MQVCNKLVNILEARYVCSVLRIPFANNQTSYDFTDFMKAGHDQYIYRHNNGCVTIAAQVPVAL